MEGRKKEDQAIICDERDVQGPHHNQAQHQICDEREANSYAAAQSIYSEHVLRVLRPRESVPSDGLALWW